MPSEKRPEKPTFFIDRSLGKKYVARALREAGVSVKVHDEIFPQDAVDEKWLAVVGARNWIVLTKDSRIRYRGIELAAVRQAGVRLFVLVSGKLSGERMAEVFVRALRRIERMARKKPGPFIAKVYRSGIVKLWTDFS